MFFENNDYPLVIPAFAGMTELKKAATEYNSFSRVYFDFQRLCHPKGALLTEVIFP